MSGNGLSVEQISFVGTLPLLRNQQPAVGPQWVRDGDSFPVAFAGPGEASTLRVNFSSTTPRGVVKVRARRVGSGLPLVSVPNVTEIDFAGGTVATADIDVRVENPPVVSIGSVVWQWEFEEAGEWREAGTSTHEIATILAAPTDPWNVTPVWCEVLRHACKGAEGARTVEEAATSIAKLTFRGFESRAYHWTGASNYATNDDDDPRAFDCAKFLRLLDGEPLPDGVDCADLSAVLSTFANSLGCNLNQFAMGRIMQLNPVLKANCKEWGVRMDEFGTHEFTGIDDGSQLTVWDGCVTVSSDDAPASPGTEAPVPADVPANMQEDTYLDRLLVNKGMGFKERELKRGVRPIGSLPKELAPAKPRRGAVEAPEVEVVLEPTAAANWVPWLEPDKVSIDGWELVEKEIPPREPPDERKEKVLRLLWQWQGSPTRLISCTIYLCRDARQAELRKKAVLSHLRGAGKPNEIKLDAIEGVPGTCLGIAKGGIIVGTVLNVVFVVKAGRGKISPEDVAQFARAVRTTIQASLAAV